MLQKSLQVCRFDQPQAEQAAFLHFKRRYNAQKSPPHQSNTPTPKPYRQLGTHGFSLIELMVAMSIFLIVSLGALPLMITNIHLNQRNQLRNEAFAVTSRWVDWLHAQHWRPTGTSLLNVPDVSLTNDGIDPGFQYAIDCTQAVVNRRYNCNVSVNWSYRGQAYTYGTSTIIIE
jgi:prepilin-type N-terminal cleavage/methylation domain-containing protein